MTPALEHLQPPFRSIALQPAAERITWIQQDRWIHYTRADEALNRIAELLACPPRNRMPCLLLTGAPGMGKTHIVQKFVRDHPSANRHGQIAGARLSDKAVAFRWAEPQRPRQHQGFGFAHRPDRRFDRIPAELFQRGHSLMAVDHQISVVVGDDYDDGRLLAGFSQRCQQPALPVRLADSQMLPSPVQLVKLQLHRSPSGSQYARSRNWSLLPVGEVSLEVPLDQ